MKTYNQFLETPLGEDKKWIQKATKNMRKDKPCTGEKFGSETCPPGSKRYNLAKTFRKMAKEGVKYYKGDDRDPTTGFPKGLKPDKKKPGEKPMTAPPYNLAKTNEEVFGPKLTKYLGKDAKKPIAQTGQKDFVKSMPDPQVVRGGKTVVKGGPTVSTATSQKIKHMRLLNQSNEPQGEMVEAKDKAFEYVKKQIAAKYGKSGYVSKDNPRKPQSAADKAKARAHQAKVDKENAAERKKDPSQGRYPKG